MGIVSTASTTNGPRGTPSSPSSTRPTPTAHRTPHTAHLLHHRLHLEPPFVHRRTGARHLRRSGRRRLLAPPRPAPAPGHRGQRRGKAVGEGAALGDRRGRVKGTCARVDRQQHLRRVRALPLSSPSLPPVPGASLSPTTVPSRPTITITHHLYSMPLGARRSPVLASQVFSSPLLFTRRNSTGSRRRYMKAGRHRPYPHTYPHTRTVVV